MPKLRAKNAFVASPRRIVGAGDIVDSSDPIVRGRELLFEAVDADEAPDTTSRAAVKKAAGAKKAAAQKSED